MLFWIGASLLGMVISSKLLAIITGILMAVKMIIKGNTSFDEIRKSEESLNEDEFAMEMKQTSDDIEFSLILCGLLMIAGSLVFGL